MVFNSFLVRLNIKDNRYSGVVISGEKAVNMGFKKILNDIFLVTSRESMKWFLLEECELVKKRKKFTVLMPVQGTFNKRKYLKVVKYLNGLEKPDRFNILYSYLFLEKLFGIRSLLPFFRITYREAVGYLIAGELKNEIKLIEVNKLQFCSHEFYVEMSEKIKEFLLVSHANRKKIINFSEFEKNFKLSPDNIFVKYLIRKKSMGLTLKFLQNRVVFEDLPLTRDEEKNIGEIISIIKKNKLYIFSISVIMKNSQKSYDEVNRGLWSLLGNDQIKGLDDKSENFIFSEELSKIINRLKKYKRNEGEILDIQAMRRITDYNRKNIIVLLEYLDSKKITLRLANNKRRLELQV